MSASGRQPFLRNWASFAAVSALAVVFALSLSLNADAKTKKVPVPRPSPAKVAPDPGAPEPPMADDEIVEEPAADAEGGVGGPLQPLDDAESAAAGSGDGSGDGSADGEITIDAAAAAPVVDLGPPADMREGTFALEARLSPDGAALTDKVNWRIFPATLDGEGKLPLLAESTGGTAHFQLEPGTYYVHAAYGRAGATRKIDVKEQTGGAIVVLNAGGMRLSAMVGKDRPLDRGEVSFDIYAPDESGADEHFLIVQNAPPGGVVALNSGIYRVVCRYGDANAVVRADIKVDPGKLTEATVYQKAARLTLKLVAAHGGEAIADTAWSVVTPEGQNVIDSVGAFPSVVLATGEYTAIAKHQGKIYESKFKVEAGLDRDIEVLLAK